MNQTQCAEAHRLFNEDGRTPYEISEMLLISIEEVYKCLKEDNDRAKS